MVNPHRNQYLATTLLLSLLILLISSSSSARPLNDFSQLSATSNLELPSDRVVMMPEKKGHVCGGKVNRPLILNMLPKGTVPPSAPSKRHNNINN
ncbi:unnamed protein product [Lathyrus sativus]|nr:unnamed protein product [Lathyrus sativus]